MPFNKVTETEETKKINFYLFWKILLQETV